MQARQRQGNGRSNDPGAFGGRRVSGTHAYLAQVPYIGLQCMLEYLVEQDRTHIWHNVPHIWLQCMHEYLLE